jgi:hypothetical protein
MKIERWLRDLRPGQRVTVAIPSDPYPTYGYATILEHPLEAEIVVRLHQQGSPNGLDGRLPLHFVFAPISEDQFEAARRLGFPANHRVGMLITNQVTVEIGDA